MAVDTSTGFKYSGRMSGGPDLWMTVKAKDTETLTPGDLINIETGEGDLAATNDVGLAGVLLGNAPVAAVDSTTDITVMYAPDAIYSVYDANARTFGQLLDLSGATGAQTVGAPTNNDFIVVGGLTADERTLVMIRRAHHLLGA